MKRGHYHTEAVVLDTLSYGESDLIVALLTKDFGKIKGIAKGAKRSKKRFVATLEPPTRISLDFFVNGKSTLVRLEDSKVVDSFSTVKADIEALSYASYFLEVVNSMTGEGESAPEVYDLLNVFLARIDSGAEPVRMARFFDVRLMKCLGYMPNLDSCVSCSGDFLGATLFSSEKGGLVCRGCAAGLTGLLPVSSGTAKTLSAASKLDMEKLGRLHTARGFVAEAEKLMHDFIRYHSGKELKTVRFIDSLRRSALTCDAL